MVKLLPTAENSTRGDAVHSRMMMGLIMAGLMAVIFTPSTMASTDDLALNARNLLVNASFEKGQYSPTGLPTGWSTSEFANTSQFVWLDHVSFAGRKSVQIISATPNDARWTQPVAVKPDTSYELSGWVKTKNVQADRSLVSDAGANVSILECISGNCFIRTPGIIGTHDWTRGSTCFTTDATTTQVTVAARLGMYAGNATGKAEFDQLDLRGRPAGCKR